MPSGAKKRKAAKKKKESVVNVNISQGNDDIKSQDDKGSDSGDVASPSTDNHHPTHNNPFSEGNNETRERSQSPSMDGAIGNVESSQKAVLESSGVTESQRDWKFKGPSEMKNGNGNGQNESLKGSYDDGRSNSSISSDAESLDATKKSEVLAGETIDLSTQTAATVYSATPELSAPEEIISVIEAASAENTLIPDMILSEKLEQNLLKADRVNENRVFYSSGEAVRGSTAYESHGQKTSPSLDSASREYSKTESEDQPLIAPRPPAPAQRTSWLSCCGLCDVLTGSNR